MCFNFLIYWLSSLFFPAFEVNFNDIYTCGYNVDTYERNILNNNVAHVVFRRPVGQVATLRDICEMEFSIESVNAKRLEVR